MLTVLPKNRSFPMLTSFGHLKKLHCLQDFFKKSVHQKNHVLIRKSVIFEQDFKLVGNIPYVRMTEFFSKMLTKF